MTPEQIVKNLKRIIIECLYRPSGPPDWHHLYSAALAYHTIQCMGMMNEDEGSMEWRSMLTQENLYEENFLTTVEEECV